MTESFTVRGTRQLAVLALSALALAAGALAQAAWHTMTGPDKSLTAELPIAPRYTPTQLKSAAGALYTMHQYVAEHGEAVYVVQTAVYPRDVNLADPKASLQVGIDSAAANMEGGKWASVDWVQHQGAVAVDAVGRRGEHEVRNFSLIKGRQYFALTYAGPPGSARSADVNRFVGSLRVK
jgi:hypothetical protein